MLLTFYRRWWYLTLWRPSDWYKRLQGNIQTGNLQEFCIHDILRRKEKLRLLCIDLASWQYFLPASCYMEAYNVCSLMWIASAWCLLFLLTTVMVHIKRHRFTLGCKWCNSARTAATATYIPGSMFDFKICSRGLQGGDAPALCFVPQRLFFTSICNAKYDRLQVNTHWLLQWEKAKSALKFLQHLLYASPEGTLLFHSHMDKYQCHLFGVITQAMSVCFYFCATSLKINSVYMFSHHIPPYLLHMFLFCFLHFYSAYTQYYCFFVHWSSPAAAVMEISPLWLQIKVHLVR